ncbi:hypothetical protein INT44_008245 [Umbelopsis vinacea]|uniref:Plasma membrane proteolipid 3 n=2 Tax=Umbelopsis TaxID=64561 RepID=A0A8H7UH18_9FUNG|nr:uncharacterized protein K450DRAFT_263034 [Umbelopsis ramanniana AG]KAG2181432.1 hypothetical protein INT44_008245 [Umbelopsis vinacea]KAI8575174.1 hypothetical protein K450DRAFT_263034 [Umbelopsis ramanniana AG]KAI9283887.1 hypothetical protein BC943DRAFT_327259 [Umbelopsis sp. AD052]
MAIACAVVIETLLAFILPPVAVFLVRGCGCSLVINILLTLLGWLPGVIHALLVTCGPRPGDLTPRRRRY